MRKTYSKPELFYENFTLIMPIASCTYSLGNQAVVEACGAVNNGDDGLTAGMTIFGNTITCDVDYIAYSGYTPGVDSFAQDVLSS